jgi:hypothetical protein
MPCVRRVIADAELQAMLARRLGPAADDVLARSDVERIPGVVCGIVVVEVVVMIGQRHEILRAGRLVQAHERVRVPMLGLP